MATIKIGVRVEGGQPGTEDYDTGKVLEIEGDRALVGWDSCVSTWADVSSLRPTMAQHSGGARFDESDHGAPTTCWSVERWTNGHWACLEGGLTRDAAERRALDYAREGVESVSIAEYPCEEGASAIARVHQKYYELHLISDDTTLDGGNPRLLGRYETEGEARADGRRYVLTHPNVHVQIDGPSGIYDVQA